MNSLKLSGNIEGTSYGIDIISLTHNINIDTKTSVHEVINIITSIIAYRMYELISSNKEVEIGNYKLQTGNNLLEDIDEHTMIACGTLKELSSLTNIEIAKVEFTEENKIKICSFISKEEFQSLVVDKLMKEEDTLKYTKIHK